MMLLAARLTLLQEFVEEIADIVTEVDVTVRQVIWEAITTGMKITTLAGVVTLLAICSTAVTAQHRIDLRQGTPAPSTPNQSGSMSGGSVGAAVEGMRPLELPLRVELTSLERSDISLGERIEFEITITNASTGTIQIPWTAGDFLSTPAPNQSEIRVAVVVAEGTPEYVVASARLYAWTSRPETFLLLRPKESAAVLAAARFQPRTTQARESTLLQSLPRMVKLKASLLMSYAASPRLATILSNNEIPTLLRRQ
jgi:hypothetical protein